MKDDRLVEMRVFRAIVENEGFTAAAHALGVSQPFVSRTLGRLEQRLGQKLVQRSTRGLRMTDEGERYLAAALQIFSALDSAEGAFSSTEAEAAGDLRVSAPLAFGIDQIVPILPKFLASHEHLKLHLSLTDTVVSLMDDHVDVAIRMGDLPSSALVKRKLCNLQRVVVASPLYIQVHGEPGHPLDLTQHNCLEWQGEHDRLNHWPFKNAEDTAPFVARGNFRSSNGLTMFAMCVAGVGIMRMAEHLALPAIRNGTLVRLLEHYKPIDMTAIHAVYPPERRAIPRVRYFVEYLAAHFQTPPWLN